MAQRMDRRKFLRAGRSRLVGDGDAVAEIGNGPRASQDRGRRRHGAESRPQPDGQLRQAAGGRCEVRLRHGSKPRGKRRQVAGRHGGQSPAGRRRLPPHPGRRRSRRAGLRRAESLARPGHDPGLRGRQARVRRKAVQPQSVRRRVDGPGGPQAQPGGADGLAAAQQAGHDRGDAESCATG